MPIAGPMAGRWRRPVLRGPLNDAIAIYFNDATLAAAFVARWCAGYRVENAKGSSGSGRGSADAAHFGWLP